MVGLKPNAQNKSHPYHLLTPTWVDLFCHICKTYFRTRERLFWSSRRQVNKPTLTKNESYHFQLCPYKNIKTKTEHNELYYISKGRLWKQLKHTPLANSKFKQSKETNKHTWTPDSSLRGRSCKGYTIEISVSERIEYFNYFFILNKVLN